MDGGTIYGKHRELQLQGRGVVGLIYNVGQYLPNFKDIRQQVDLLRGGKFGSEQLVCLIMNICGSLRPLEEIEEVMKRERAA